jgi:hypothetical protein
LDAFSLSRIREIFSPELINRAGVLEPDFPFVERAVEQPELRRDRLSHFREEKTAGFSCAPLPVAMREIEHQMIVDFDCAHPRFPPLVLVRQMTTATASQRVRLDPDLIPTKAMISFITLWKNRRSAAGAHGTFQLLKPLFRLSNFSPQIFVFHVFCAWRKQLLGQMPLGATNRQPTEPLLDWVITLFNRLEPHRIFRSQMNH